MRPKTFQLANGTIVQNTLTASEQASALAAYYHAPMAPVPGRVLQGLNQGPINASKMMPFTDINRLFDPGYLPDENCYGVFNDGSCYAASLIDMPGVTGEILDWWFAWHPLEAIRYKIWFPSAHFGISADDPDRLADTTLSYQDRYQEMSQYPVEDVGGSIEQLEIHFVTPEHMGFDTRRMTASGVPTIICGDVGNVSPNLMHTKMVHFIRNTSGGVEMRSRFWMMGDLQITGHKTLSKLVSTKPGRRFVTRSEHTTALELAHNMAQHDAAEYHNLASILPELYAKYRN